MDDLGAPRSYLTLGKGTTVVDSGGEEVGTVEHVLAAPEADIFDGLVVTTGDGRRFVEGPLVEEIYERAVVLTIPAADVARLPDPSENPDGMGGDPGDVAGGIGDKLRRAWHAISSDS